MLQQGHRVGSPSLANLASIVSPTGSPFSPDGVPGMPMGHQRHQSLQFGALPFPPPPAPVRASPCLQELREVEEEGLHDVHPPLPNPGLPRPNQNESLQREIEEAEYHLEEQMRSQLENDRDYSPHKENDKPGDALAPQLPRYSSNTEGLVLHHPRPHSRGHSLSQRYFTEEDAANAGPFKPTLQSINAHPGEDDEVIMNPNSLGTPVQALDFANLLSHQRGLSSSGNPWADTESNKPADAAHRARSNHASKPSFSKLNVEAPEFKFNPSTGSFNFSSAFSFQPNPLQPMSFNMGFNNNADASHSGLPRVGSSSKINANAPVFSPGQSEFNFSTSGPKFRPDAPAFTPHTVSTAMTSPMTSDSGSNRASSIFGNIDLSGTDTVKPGERPKAIPVVRPKSRDEAAPGAIGLQEGPDGRPIDDSRVKRIRAAAEKDDTVPQFAEPPKEDAIVSADAAPRDDPVPVEEKSFDDSHLGTMASTMVSETTDTKPIVTPSEPSPGQPTVSWASSELKSTLEVQQFNDTRPSAFENTKHIHKKSLSATAEAFVPGATAWGGKTSSADEASISEVKQAAPTEPAGDVDTSAKEELMNPHVKEESCEPVQDLTKKEAPSPLPTAASPQSPLAPKGLAASQFTSLSPSAKPKTGLAASRFAATPSPVSEDAGYAVGSQRIITPATAETPSLAPGGDELDERDLPAEPTMADIDEVMRRLQEQPEMGVNRTYDVEPEWQPEPTLEHHSGSATEEEDSSAERLPQEQIRSVVPSPGLGKLQPVEAEGYFDKPSHDIPSGADGPIYHLNGARSIPNSDWESVFSEGEQTKLQYQVAFDRRVNEVVGNLLASKLGPLERALENINNSLAGFSRRPSSSRRSRRSISADIQTSDADDEDDEMPLTMRSISPRRDRRMEQIRTAVLDALAIQRRNQAKEATPVPVDNSEVLAVLEEVKEQLRQPTEPAIRSEDIKSILSEVLETRMPTLLPPPVGNDEEVKELRARIAELEKRVHEEAAKAEAEAAARQAAENRAAEISRELQTATTRIEVEMMNKSALNQRIHDLEERAEHAESQAEKELQHRRTAEDKAAEFQRLLQVASEDEKHLRKLANEKDERIKALESAQSDTLMRLAMLEGSQASAQQTQSEWQNRINDLEAELRDTRKDAQHWRMEVDRIMAIAQRNKQDLSQTLDENKALHRLIDTLGTQLQENERVRDTWRSKFIALQDEMAQAMRQLTEENARRMKREQALLSRQEVLEARLQAEARTRERIETELERLEMGERQGMRAVAECKRLEALLVEMRNENHKLHQTAMRFQAEFQEARETAAREIKRTRDALQAELENANHQVNVIREEYEEQIARLRAQLDQVKLDADTAKARHEMLLEEAETSKRAAIEALLRKHQNEIEDMQTRYERQLSNATEDAQRAEQNLLERLSISTSKIECLQEKVAHLEEKLEIAKEAARAAAQAAKSAVGAESVQGQAVPSPRQLGLPEKISPQALRETIMVLQDQLQEREQRIEDLETKLAKVDPDAETKIAKRDDEIMWLRELLAVRHSDLQDIITALETENFDRAAVRDAAIRLKANLQMEEQERERALNGGSALSLPNIAATIREAAARTPRVAQAVGPLAAAWGSLRKAREAGLASVLSSPAPARNSTPSKSGSSQASSGASGLLGSLLTPASQTKQTAQAAVFKQATAFNSTGPQDLANRTGPLVSASAMSMTAVPVSNHVAEGQTTEAEPSIQLLSPLMQATASLIPQAPQPLRPVTPPNVMLRASAYDSDAQAAGDFDDTGFFEDD